MRVHSVCFRVVWIVATSFAGFAGIENGDQFFDCLQIILGVINLSLDLISSPVQISQKIMVLLIGNVHLFLLSALNLPLCYTRVKWVN